MYCSRKAEIEGSNPSPGIFMTSKTLRVWFVNETARKRFFNSARRKCGSTKEMSQKLGINNGTLGNYVIGRHSIPLEIFEIIRQKYVDFEELIFPFVLYKDLVWERRKYGLKVHEIHPDHYKKGYAALQKYERKRGQAKHKFPINTPLTADLAEFIGAYIGDGCGFKHPNTGEIGIVGNAKLDRNYLNNFIPKKISTFAKKCKICFYYRLIDNSMQLKVYSQEFHNLMIQRFRFPQGKKCYTVTIPPEVWYADDYILAKCLRGIFDTDGGVFFDRRKVYKKPYIRIAAQLESPNLIEQMYEGLIRLGVSATISKKHNVQINGETNCKKFLEVVGFSNKRHLSKVAYLM
jgi:hypothetical protein